MGVSDAFARARKALDRGHWEDAHELLLAADVFANGTVAQLELFANAAYAAGDYEGTVTAWETIHGRQLEAGEALSAAHAAAMVAMYLMMDSGLLAPVRGWLNRADALLEGHRDTPVHALSAMVRMYERFMSGSHDEVEPLAQRAITLGEAHDVVPAFTLGRVGLARRRILSGDVDEGLAMLDDVALFLVSGSVDPLTAGMVWCELVCAMLGLGQYDRAAEWTAAFDRQRRRGEFFGGINGRCRVHRAEMLRLRGSCEQAEDEALQACEELRPWMRREFGWPLTELGTIRLRRGDLAGAEEAFRAAQVNGWDPQPGLALLHLARGELTEAGAMIAEALEHPGNVPSKERPPNLPLTRAPLLEAQALIGATAGDAQIAAAAAEELAEIADFYGSQGLEAAAALARGRAALVVGQATTAVDECRRAVDVWRAIGLPWETASARLALAAALRATGADDTAAMEENVAATVLEGIGAAHPDDLDGGPDAAAPASRSDAEFRVDGDMRVLVFANEQVLLRDLKGMRYIARLLDEPGREFHVLDLVAVEHGTLPIAGEATVAHDGLSVQDDDAGPMIDETARAAYRRQLREIDQDIAEAQEMGDSGRAELARADREFIVTELSRAFGIGGRARSAVSTSERARSAVTRAIRYALQRIREQHSRLADHLESTISTGTYCRYEPDTRVHIAWRT